jgi:hypothetical protein
MRGYKNEITLTQNSRGVWSLDPSLGCNAGTKQDEKGCYGDCYAARSSKKYGYDFSKTVLRDFTSISHLESIKRKIKRIDMPFIRMGTNGDPSENWEHTVKIIEAISNDKQLSLFKEGKKQIVIITKHWNKLTNNQLKRLYKYNICINTSVSALDDELLLHENLNEYERLKKYCKSVLRVVSFDFNLKSKKGLMYNLMQEYLFNNYEVLDTVFRCSKNNPLHTEGIINIHKTKFLGKKCYISKKNKKTYFGKCSSCLEMCGMNM